MRAKLMNKNQVSGALTIRAGIQITNCPSAMPLAKTSMPREDSTAMASRQPPRWAAARNGAGRLSQSVPTIIAATTITR